MFCAQNAGTVTCHNVCKRHVAFDTVLNVLFFSTLFQWTKIVTAFMCIFVETMPKLSVNFANHISQDSHNNKYPGPVCNFGFTEPQYSDKC